MFNDTDKDGAATDSTNAAAPISVTNNKGFDIPETGDDSMMFLTIMGTIMVVCAGAVIVMIARSKKRKTA